MTDTVAKLNKSTTWTPASTSDTITCYDISQNMRNGVQIDADTFNLESATVTVTLPVSGSTKTVTVAAGTGESALIGEGFSMAAISISGIAAGTYTVRFSQ